MNRGGFSWKRATGISGAKAKLSRKIGIPLTKSGRQRKYGAAMGCATFLLAALAVALITGVALSHPGRTDKYGGHTDSKTGAYHYHGGGSASSLSYATSTYVSEEPVVTVDDLMAQLREAWLVGELERAIALCDQIKVALAEEKAARAVEEAPVASTQSLQSPASFDAGDGVTGTIEFPVGTAYILTDKYSTYGDISGSVKIAIPGSLAVDNKFFKVGSSIFTAEYGSSDSSVVSVDGNGRMTVRNEGRADITVAIGSARILIPVTVTRLPIGLYSSKSDIVQAMGFPDDITPVGYGTELWRWNKHSDLCLAVGGVRVEVRSRWSGRFDSIWK